jgi:uncharacterized protein YegJ (DUF2314 family)
MSNLRALFAALALLTLAACEPQHDPIVDFAADDAAMNAAENEAKQTLPIFWRLFDSGDPARTDFMVKVAMKDARGGDEHIWVDSLQRRDGAVIGRLANEPRALTGLSYGSEVTVNPALISDWAYAYQGKLYGNYTTRAMLPHLSDRERAETEVMLSATPLEPTAI